MSVLSNWSKRAEFYWYWLDIPGVQLDHPRHMGCQITFATLPCWQKPTHYPFSQLSTLWKPSLAHNCSSKVEMLRKWTWFSVLRTFPFNLFWRNSLFRQLKEGDAWEEVMVEKSGAQCHKAEWILNFLRQHQLLIWSPVTGLCPPNQLLHWRAVPPPLVKCQKFYSISQTKPLEIQNL